MYALIMDVILRLELIVAALVVMAVVLGVIAWRLGRIAAALEQQGRRHAELKPEDQNE